MNNEKNKLNPNFIELIKLKDKCLYQKIIYDIKSERYNNEYDEDSLKKKLFSYKDESNVYIIEKSNKDYVIYYKPCVEFYRKSIKNKNIKYFDTYKEAENFYNEFSQKYNIDVDVDV